MSFEAIRWARQQPVDPTLKSVLVSLAERANKNYDCFPSFSRISKDTSFSRRSVIRSVIALEKLGLIQKKHRYTNYGQTSNLYTLTAFAANHESSVEIGAVKASADVAPPPVPQWHSPSATMAPKNKNNEKPSIEETTTAPPENPPICENLSIFKVIIDEPVVVVTQEPVLVLAVEPTTALPEIMPDLTVLDVLDEKEKNIVAQEPVLPAEPTTALPEIMPDLTVLDVFDAKEKNIVTKELKKVTDLTAQAVILFTLKTAIVNNKVKNSPIAMVLRLIDLATNDLLVTKYAVAKMKAGQSASTPQNMPPVDDYRAQRIMRIRNLAAKHPECVEVMKKRGAFTFPSDARYMYFPHDFSDAGLM